MTILIDERTRETDNGPITVCTTYNRRKFTVTRWHHGAPIRAVCEDMLAAADTVRDMLLEKPSKNPEERLRDLVRKTTGFGA